jgi:hypothetical protein
MYKKQVSQQTYVNFVKMLNDSFTVLWNVLFQCAYKCQTKKIK